MRPLPRFLSPLALLALAGCGGEGAVATSPADTAVAGTAVSRPVPDETPPVTLAAATHGEFLAELERHRGEVVLLDCWATWCGPCRAGFPHTVELAAKYRGRGLTVISVAFDEPDDAESVRAFLEQTGAGGLTNFVTANGPGNEAFARYEVTGGALPHLKVYGRDGTVAATFGGTGTAVDPAEVAAAIERALKTTGTAG